MRQILICLEEIVKQMQPDLCNKYLPQVEQIRHRLDYPDMKLAIIGNFSCGKSTFLNALLRTSLLTMDNMPTTAVPTYIDWNGKDGKTVISIIDTVGVKHLMDQDGRKWFHQATGNELPMDRGELLDYLTTTNTLTGVLSKIKISFPEENGYKGFSIIDTPGINPGDEEASDHILKTQALLRDEADAAIILFPSYQVYTRDFQEFLDQNAKHLLANSIFVVSKIDLISSQKETDKVLLFVKSRLEQYFGLEDPDVFGCSAGRALDYYTGNIASKDSWTDSFEHMLKKIFCELEHRRKRIVAEKVKKMLESLISELQAEMRERQQALIKTQQGFARYSYENLEKEYKNGLSPYYQAIRITAIREKEVIRKAVQGRAESVLNEMTLMVNSARNAEQINELTEKTFQDKMRGLGTAYEKMFLNTMQSLNDQMYKKYTGLMTAMQKLLKRYQYNVGEFETFACGKRKIEGQHGLAAGTSKSGKPTVDLELTDWRKTAAVIAMPVLAAFGLIGAVVGWVLYRFTLSMQKEKVNAQIKENIEKYVGTVMLQYDESIQQLQNRYKEAGDRLLTEYTEEYKTFFGERVRQIEALKADIEIQVKKNEKMITDMDGMLQAMYGRQ